MIIPVLWHDQKTGNWMVPDWGRQVPAAIPAQSPFAAKRQQEVRETWAALMADPDLANPVLANPVLANPFLTDPRTERAAQPVPNAGHFSGEMDLLGLETIEPTCLALQDDASVHLALVGAEALIHVWPLVDQILALPFAGERSPAWQSVDPDWARYQTLLTSSRGRLLQRPSPVAQIDALVRAGSCDLHLHTTASDGTDTPEEMFARIQANRLKSFAVTDHDLLDSLDTMAELVAAACQDPHDPYCPVFVPGVEISIAEGRELHVLGYFPNGEHQRLAEFLTQQRLARHNRNVDMVHQLQSLGYAITLDELVDKGQGVVGRMQAALLLTERGYVRSTQEAFEKVLGFGKPGYIERPRPSLQEAVWQIRKVGGVPVLAHPAIYHWCGERPIVQEKLVKKLRDAQSKGLLGVEAFHGEASREACLEISAAARYLGLLRTCGSDDHGRNKKNTRLFDASTHFLAGKEILVVGALIKADENKWLVTRGLAASGAVQPVKDPMDAPESGPSQPPTRYLLARRATSGHGQGQWELPGGKVETGENPRAALQRELREELGLESEIGQLAELLTHEYAGFRIILACYFVRLQDGTFQPTAHDQFRWVTAQDALELDVLAADVALFQELASQKD